MARKSKVAIIGAGPYGLSAAAHLQRHVPTVVFGHPMETWSQHMPPGMLLKSEAFATNLSMPDRSFTLKRYARDRGLDYQDYGLPVPLSTFVTYGRAFQEKLVPDLDRRKVVTIRRIASGFQLTLDDGSTTTADKIIVAAGIRHYAYLPPGFVNQPNVTHSAEYGSLSGLIDKDVVVVGTGSSAADIANLLHQDGGRVRLIGRALGLQAAFPVSPQRSIVNRCIHPLSRIGLGWKSLALAELPAMFHTLPEQMRLKIVRRHLGPAPGASAYDYASKHLDMKLGVSIKSLRQVGAQVALKLETDGLTQEIMADHVIAATGYRVDLRRLSFLDPLLADVAHVNHTPKLSSTFESSVSGLYFIGATAANAFGPAMRFVYGCGWVAPRVARAIR